MSERTLTPEVREKLLGIMPFSSEATIWFSPERYKNIDDESFRAKFEIKSFTKEEYRQAKKLLLGGIDASNFTGKEQQIIEMTRKKVVNWKNLFDLGTLEEIPFTAEEDGGASKELYASIPSVIQGQIFAEITKISGLIDQEKLSLKS